MYETVMTIVVILIVGLTGFAIFAVFHTSNNPNRAVAQSSQRPNGNYTNNYAILGPATVPSKVPECSHAISFQSNGNSGPIQCANGDLNTIEWKALAALEPSVMSLGYSPSISQLQTDLCNDANASNSDANTKNSYVTEATIYQISALYYGWHFSSNPATILTNGGCG
jgi:hypothetical protein